MPWWGLFGAGIHPAGREHLTRRNVDHPKSSRIAWMLGRAAPLPFFRASRAYSHAKLRRAKNISGG